MFRFTIRQLLGLTAIVALSCLLTIVLAPADPFSQLMMAGFLSVFGGACFAAGIALGRHDKIAPPNS